MPQRTVQIGVMTYDAGGGLGNQFALHGAVVNVTEEDIERFDRLNGTVEQPKPRPGRKGRERA